MNTHEGRGQLPAFLFFALEFVLLEPNLVRETSFRVYVTWVRPHFVPASEFSEAKYVVRDQIIDDFLAR